MHYFLGNKDKKADKQVSSEITPKIKNSLKKQFCQICEKAPSTKLAFGNEVNPAFTCANCELKAVNNNIQKMGEKNLISNDTFA